MWKSRGPVGQKKHMVDTVQLSQEKGAAYEQALVAAQQQEKEEARQNALKEARPNAFNSAHSTYGTYGGVKCTTNEDCAEDQECLDDGMCGEVYRKHSTTTVPAIVAMLAMISFIVAVVACVRHSWKLGNNKCTSGSSKLGVEGGQRMRLINDLTICTWLFMGFPVLNVGLASGLMFNVNMCGKNVHVHG